MFIDTINPSYIKTPHKVFLYTTIFQDQVTHQYEFLQ